MEGEKGKEGTEREREKNELVLGRCAEAPLGPFQTESQNKSILLPYWAVHASQLAAPRKSLPQLRELTLC